MPPLACGASVPRLGAAEVAPTTLKGCLVLVAVIVGVCKARSVATVVERDSEVNARMQRCQLETVLFLLFDR